MFLFRGFALLSTLLCQVPLPLCHPRTSSSRESASQRHEVLLVSRMYGTKARGLDTVESTVERSREKKHWRILLGQTTLRSTLRSSVGGLLQGVGWFL